jgi:aerotolerance regulator-like protein
MTFLAPGFLLAAGIVSASIIALHFIGTLEPETVPFPTARFASDRPVHAVTRAFRLQDLLLLALRVALVMAVGAALARPVISTSRRAIARIIVVDRSRAVANRTELVDSASALVSDGDALVVFDSSAVVIRHGTTDSLRALVLSPRSGRLSTALIVALRAASVMRNAADSLELTLVSPFAAQEMDGATDSIRALWPGAVRLVRIAARREMVTPPVTEISSALDDPLRLALPTTVAAHGQPNRRIVRGPLGTSDLAWAKDSGHVLVHWPAIGSQEADADEGWVGRAPVDTVGALIAGDVVVVAPFERVLAYSRGTNRASQAARVKARWVDGEPAAVDFLTGAGCIRSVAIPVPSRGDLILRPQFARLVEELLGPCGEEDSSTRGEPSIAAFPGEPATRGVVSSRVIPATEDVAPPISIWLLVSAVCFALGEFVVRRRVSGSLPEGGM